MWGRELVICCGLDLGSTEHRVSRTHTREPPVDPDRSRGTGHRSMLHCIGPFVTAEVPIPAGHEIVARRVLGEAAVPDADAGPV